MANLLTFAEREAIGLCICCDALSSLVSQTMLQFAVIEGRSDEMEVRFPTGVHQDLFLIRLLDFTNESGAATPLGNKDSCLGVLGRAASQRRLYAEGDSDPLSEAVTSLNAWLTASIERRFLLPTIHLQPRLRLTRHQALWVSSNQASHNPSKLIAASKAAKTSLNIPAPQLPTELMPFLLDDLRAHLSDRVFIHYATQITRLLNDIRWALQGYLAPLYVQAFHLDGGHPPRYRFDAPHLIRPESPAYKWFQRLMNHVRAGPPIPPFQASISIEVLDSLGW
ncbi:hypothetical protein KK141_11170 [Dyella sp. LX-66]|uniref:hypothetical protein n=1 Tax=unclassified Dyella TaxID=2634549 RepID=UPI001BE0FCD0|nr:MULTISPECIES: hypothetical protein [unclassified Dyella]MBT2118915.1 hypothetical protein [Dyella sp. LX-1]MBT2140091.1 hypothetical protein [Dyella sp. LX-66]